MTKDGTIKRIPITSYKTQNRKGKGVKNQGTIVTHTIRTNTIDSLMIFSDKGKIYRLLVDKIPEGTNTSKGTSIKNLVTMGTNENPTIIYSIYKGSDNNYVLFATKNGLIKKTPLEEYLKTQKSGLAAIKLKEDDEIVAVTLFKNEEFIILTEQGFSIRIKGESIPTSTRNTMGCRGNNLKKEDKIVALLPIRNNTDDVGIFYKSGKGKRVKIDEFTVQLKGGKGVLCGKNDIVVGGILLNDEDNVLINGATKSICIKALDIPQGSRVGSGNLLLQENIITSVSKL
jgi:DNA gyrase subunit A